jgi:transcriptional regulator with XRE-family HTH domain
MAYLIQVRNAHGKKKSEVARCMGMTLNAYRHYETGKSHLPDFLHGRMAWVRKFLECVGATPDEIEHARGIAASQVLREFEDRLDA